MLLFGAVLGVIFDVLSDGVEGFVLQCADSKPINVVEPLEIEFPGGNLHYGNDLRCRWTFKGYGPLALRFSHMDLEHGENGRCYDYVYAAGRMDCNMSFQNFTSDEEMELEFISDGNGGHSGFVAVVENSCPMFSDNCDMPQDTDPDNSLLVYTVHRHSGRELDLGRDDLRGHQIDALVTLDAVLFEQSRGNTFCHRCHIMKQASQIPSCHSDSSADCEWTTSRGIHYTSGYVNMIGKTFVVIGNAEFRTKQDSIKVDDVVCIDFQYFFNERYRSKPNISLAAIKRGSIVSIQLESLQLKSKGVWKTERIVKRVPPEFNEAGFGLALKIYTEEDEHVLVNKIYGCVADSPFDRIPLIDKKNYQGTLYSFEEGKLREKGDCKNGGLFDGEKCRCPPSFNGTLCEFYCGLGRYGPRCEAQCPADSCSNKIFCKRGLGCQCGAGFKGNYCGIPCDRNEYGTNCRLKCGHCKNRGECDTLTGQCTGGCQQGYSPPDCQRKYPHAKVAPVVTPFYRYSILRVNVDRNTVEGFADASHYKFQFRENLPADSTEDTILSASDTWNETTSLAIPQDRAILYNLTGLDAGTDYAVRFIVLTDSGHGYYGNEIPVAFFSTKCSGYNPLDVIDTQVTHNSVYLKWEDRYKNEIACPTEQTQVEIYDNSDVAVERIVSKNYINITSLKSKQEYTFTIKPLFAPNRDFTNVSVTTLAPDFGSVDFLEVATVTATEITLEWEPKNSNSQNRFAVRYKCVKLMAGLNSQCEGDSGQTETSRARVQLRGLLPYRKYELKVQELPGYEYSRIYATTKPAIPETKPVLLGTLITTQNGFTANWATPENCSLCNGEIIGYQYRLIYEDGNRKSSFVQNGTLTVDDLEPSTVYKLLVFLKNEAGWNDMYPLELTFSTKKATNLGEIGQLKVYARSEDSLSLKWVVTGEPHLFKIGVVGGELRNVKPTRCQMWPHMYCTNITRLEAKREYNVTLRAVLAGGLKGPTRSIADRTVEEAPESPVDISLEDAGEDWLSIVWAPPDRANGILRSFVITPEPTEGPDCCETYPPSNVTIEEERVYYSADVMGLTPGTSYTVKVAANTTELGPPVSLRAWTRPPKPPVPPGPTVSGRPIIWQQPEQHTVHPASEYTKRPYLLLVLSEHTFLDDIKEPDLQDAIRGKLGKSSAGPGFYLAAEYKEGDEIVVGDENAIVNDGTWGTIRNPPLIKGRQYRLAAVAVSQYKTLHSVALNISAPFTA